MTRVAIVTDSTAYIPSEITNGYPIFSAPLQVIWDGQTYRDGIDIQPKEFYERLQRSKSMPTTSQATPAAFIDLYGKLLEEGYSILSIHISAKLSGTLDSATQALEQFPGAQIELVDSDSTSMALGFQVMSVARVAAQGATLQECAAVANQARTHTGLFFVVNTLEFLHRGGRIGGAAAFIGTAIGLKPILELRDGRIEAVEKVRTHSKAVDRMINIFNQKVGTQRPVRLAALHANAPEECSQLLERARQCFGTSEVSDAVLTEISPVLGVHAGPGTIGLAFMAGM
jgi:DegV family protein with EDD domain